MAAIPKSYHYFKAVVSIMVFHDIGNNEDVL